MRAVRAVYDKGTLKLAEPVPEEGPIEVLVVFPDATDDLWERIENEPTLRPAFAKFMQDCQEQINQGQAKPLELKDL